LTNIAPTVMPAPNKAAPKIMPVRPVNQQARTESPRSNVARDYDPSAFDQFGTTSREESIIGKITLRR
jgi:hypothetical protein